MAGKSTLVEFNNLLAAGGLPDLGPGPRPGVMSHAELTGKLDSLLRDTSLHSTSQDLVRGLILLWHDRLEPAHEIAQGIENSDGSFLHGILHRREPDYGNAAYWFRRVGSHACYPKIAEKSVAFFLSKNDLSLKNDLNPHGEWDPFAFIRLCETAAAGSATPAQRELLREIQGIESRVLLEHWLN